MAILQKETCNLRHPMGLRHPVFFLEYHTHTTHITTHTVTHSHTFLLIILYFVYHVTHILLCGYSLEA